VRESLTWVEGNAERLPFPDGAFDLYTIAFGLRNVTNRCVHTPAHTHTPHSLFPSLPRLTARTNHRDKALAEAFRVLKRGGRVMCLEFSHVALPVAREAYDLYSFEVGTNRGRGRGRRCGDALCCC